MENYPRTSLEFDKWFSSEEACREYLYRIRWPEGFRCPRCNNRKAWKTARNLYHCAHCGHETSITAGTIFQDTRKPLHVWFRVIWYIVNQKNGVSALGLKRVLGFRRYETVWMILHKLRSAMVRPGRERLTGIVEVDETYVGGKKTGKRGRGAEGKSLVLVAVEDKGKEFGRIRLKKIADASARSLIAAIRENIELGSSVRTDTWKGYTNISSSGYTHIKVNQSSEIGEKMLSLAHRVASLLKRWLQGTHQGAIDSHYLDYYLDEFSFRFNRRSSQFRGKLFYRLIQQSVTVEPVRSKDIGDRSNVR